MRQQADQHDRAKRERAEPARDPDNGKGAVEDDQDPGERQKRNQDEKDDPLAA